VVVGTVGIEGLREVEAIAYALIVPACSWGRGTGRRNEFRLLAKELMERAKQKSKPAAQQ
jgi:hypothetical protein